MSRTYGESALGWSFWAAGDSSAKDFTQLAARLRRCGILARCKWLIVSKSLRISDLTSVAAERRDSGIATVHFGLAALACGITAALPGLHRIVRRDATLPAGSELECRRGAGAPLPASASGLGPGPGASTGLASALGRPGPDLNDVVPTLRAPARPGALTGMIMMMMIGAGAVS